MGPRDPDGATETPTLDETTVFRRSRMGYLDIVVSLGASAFLVGMMFLSIALIGSGEPAGFGFFVIAGAMSAFIVPATLVGLGRVIRDGTILTLTPDGLVLHAVGYIPWTDVDRMEIEDLAPLVQEPGTKVVGSMRQIAIHLRPGVEAPPGSTLDAVYRRIARGYLAVGEKAGRGRFHWLGVKEREIDGRLEDILDLATMYHAAVVGLEPYTEAAVTDSAATTEPPAPTVVSDLAGDVVGDRELADEARRISAAADRDSRRRPDVTGRRRRFLIGLGIVGGVAVISLFLGWTLFGASRNGVGPPWPFIAFALLAGGLQMIQLRAARDGSWARRPLAASFPVAIAAFMAGVIGASVANGTFGTTTARSDPSATATATASARAGQVRLTARAATELVDAPARFAIDGQESTMWNAGQGPPDWILVDLGTERSVTAVRLLVEQTPAGRTVHQILVNGADGGEFERIHTFEGTTASGEWLIFHPATPIRNVRRVVIETVEGPSWVAWREIVIAHE